MRSFLALVASLLLIHDIFLTVLQADNVCLVFGLISITCLARQSRAPSTVLSWGAAFFGVAAVFAKLHGAAVIGGELLWLTLVFGWRQSAAFLARVVFCSAAWILGTLGLAASPRAIWEHVVLIPMRLPWAPDLLERLNLLRLELLLMVILPGLTILALNRLKVLGRLSHLLASGGCLPYP
jgi:hypothetical protein